MNTFVSPWLFAWRLEAKTTRLPSGENIGNPSNVSLNARAPNRVRRRNTRRSNVEIRDDFTFLQPELVTLLQERVANHLESY